MAVGVPATGMGGIFYILLSIAVVVHKAVKKILCFFGKRIGESKEKLGLYKFPTLAFILCVGMLLYMNLSGVRFTMPGTLQTTVSISNLWLVGLFAFSLFTFFVVLVQIRSGQIEKPQFWVWRARIAAENHKKTLYATETAKPIFEPRKDPDSFLKISQGSYSPGSTAAVTSNSMIEDPADRP